MKVKANNNSNKLVKVTYEYLSDTFIENPNGWAEHVTDNGDIVRGEWHKDWCEGVDEIPEDDVEKYISLGKKMTTRRNFVVHH